MFTAVATLQLVEAGKLALDEPIGTYLADYPNEIVASTATARSPVVDRPATAGCSD